MPPYNKEPHEDRGDVVIAMVLAGLSGALIGWLAHMLLTAIRG